MPYLLCIIVFMTVALPAHAQSGASKLQGLISELSDDIRANYILEPEANAMSELLQRKLESGEYDNLPMDDALANRIQADLRSVFDDKHLRIRYGANKPSRNSYPPSLPNGMELTFDDNIAIISTTHFPGASTGYRSAVKAIMTRLSDADGVIIDMRNNRGGSPDAVQLVCSYFLEEGILLNSLYFRNRDVKRDFYTIKTPVKFLDKPIILLTSERTFSAGEEFSYNLKHLQRATLIGETTGGGAHPVNSFTLPYGFRATIPVGKAINPVTNTNWEGTGVIPDIKMESNSAMEVALERMKSGTK